MRQRSPAAAERSRGFALLVVLWTLVLLTLILMQLLAAGRSDMKLAGNMRAAAISRAAADGAISDTIFHLLIGDLRVDGPPRTLRIGGSIVLVRAQTLADKINPNIASTALLAGLFQAEGLAAQQAKAVAQAMIVWREPATDQAAAAHSLADYRRSGRAFAPPGRPFADLSELGAVMGMTPQLLARLQPHLSLQQSGDPNPALADPVVREALKLAGQTGAQSGTFNGSFPVVTITAVAHGPGRATALRRAVVSMAGLRARSPYRIIRLTGP